MFYFVNLGTYLTYSIATLAVGGGGYVTWCFKDEVLTSLVQTKNLATTSNHNVSETFSKQLENTTQHQEEITQAELEIEQLTENINKTDKELGDLYKTIEGLKGEVTNWGIQISSSSKTLEQLKKDQTTQTALVESLQKAFDDQQSIVSNYDVTEITRAVAQAQQNLQASDAHKEKTEQDLNTHNLQIKQLTDLLAKSSNLLQDLNSKKSKTEEGMDKNQKEIKTDQDSKDAKTTDIKTQISNYISTISSKIEVLNTSITQLNKDVYDLKNDISHFDDELKQVDSLKKDDGKPLTSDEKQQKRVEINNKKSPKTSSLQTKTNKMEAEKEGKIQKEAEKNEWQQQHDNLSSAKEFATDNSGLKTAVTNVISEIQELEQKIAKLNSDQTQLTTEKDYLVLQIANTIATNDGLDVQKTTLASQTDDLTKKKTAAHQDYDSKKQALAVAQTQQTEKIRNIAESTEDLIKKATTLSEAKSVLMAVTEGVSCADQKHQELLEQHSVLKEKLSKAEADYKNIFAELTTQQQHKTHKEKAYELKKQT